jgi:hypothetical protein
MGQSWQQSSLSLATQYLPMWPPFPDYILAIAKGEEDPFSLSALLIFLVARLQRVIYKSKLNQGYIFYFQPGQHSLSGRFFSHFPEVLLKSNSQVETDVWCQQRATQVSCTERVHRQGCRRCAVLANGTQTSVNINTLFYVFFFLSKSRKAEVLIKVNICIVH